MSDINETSIFEIARHIADSDVRAAYVDQVCGEDLALKSRVDALLKASDDEPGFMELPPTGFAGPLADTSHGFELGEKTGDQIGNYKLREKIGEGGFGVVYVAEQAKPVRRKVALKIIKPGMDTKEVIARFEAERQALALMDHPNIARVVDAGTTGLGRPYFAMELVHGVPITEFCDKNRLPTEQRLSLFIDICHAVHHAHQKGVIHRDLKPSNVMVTLHDGKPVAKVIDFGVSKALSQQLTDKSIYTAYGQMIGTPAYMSPEQAEMSGLGVDTRSDIYSLGVLLYELLTGAPPLESKRLLSAGYNEMLRIIREEEPARPSTKVSSLGAQATIVADHRCTNARTLSQRLRGELDWIVMKALDKDRERRYESANGFASDVQRFLNDDTVLACPPSASYRLRKFARRNKAAFAIAAAIAVALLVGLTATTWQMFRAVNAEEIANSQAGRARAEAQRANEAATRADEEAAEKELARKAAEDNLEIAQTERLRADENAASFARQLYASLLTGAEAAIREGNTKYAQQLLGMTPEELRGWEYEHLTLRANPKPLLEELTGKAPRFTTTGDIRGRDGSKLMVWDGDTGELKSEASPPDGIVPWIFSQDDSKFLVHDRGAKALKLWDISKQEEIWSVELTPKGIRKAIFSPNGKYVLTRGGRGPGGMRILTLRSGLTGEVIARREMPLAFGRSFEFSPDGKRIATANVILEAASLEVVSRLQTTDIYDSSATFSPDGKQLLTSDTLAQVHLWETDSGELIQTLKGHSGSVFDLAFSPDGNRIATCSWDSTVRVSDLGVRGFSPLRTVGSHDGLVMKVTFGPQGNRIASSGNREIKVWDAASGVDAFAIRAGSGTVGSVAFNPAGNRIASTSSDGTVTIWDTDSGKEVMTLQGHDALPFYIAYHPSEPIIASSQADGVVILWNARTGRALRKGIRAHAIQGGGQLPLSPYISFSPDGKHFATVGMDGDLRVWGLDGNMLFENPIGTTLMPQCVWSPNGKWIATNSKNTVTLWDSKSGTEVRTLSGHTGGVYALAISRDSKTIACGCNGGVIQLWDSSTGDRKLKLKGRHPYITRLTFGPHGDRIWSAGADGQINAYDARSGDELVSLRGYGLGEIAINDDGIIAIANENKITLLETEVLPQLAAQRRAIQWAQRIVDERFTRLTFADEVMDSLQSDEELDPSTRKLAMEITATRGDNAYLLNNASWKVVQNPTNNDADLQVALRKSEIASALFPNSPRYATTLGVAQYRNGSYAEAITALKRADELDSATEHGSHPCTVTFNAMAAQSNGDADLASRELARARQLLSDQRWELEVDLRRYLREAEQLIQF